MSPKPSTSDTDRHDRLSDRLLGHLQGADEDARQALERAALEDDELFDQLRAAEAELVDRYVGGELDGDVALRLAELVGRSPRLQESAETTLALGVATAEKAKPSAAVPAATARPERPRLGSDRWSYAAALLAALCILSTALALAVAVEARRDLGTAMKHIEDLQTSHRALEADVGRLEREMDDLRREQLRLRRAR